MTQIKRRIKHALFLLQALNGGRKEVLVVMESGALGDAYIDDLERPTWNRILDQVTVVVLSSKEATGKSREDGSSVAV